MATQRKKVFGSEMQDGRSASNLVVQQVKVAQYDWWLLHRKKILQ
jgi:hypothetical protein